MARGGDTLVAACWSPAGQRHPVYSDSDPAQQQAAAQPGTGSAVTRSRAPARTLGEAARGEKRAKRGVTADIPVLDCLFEVAMRTRCSRIPHLERTVPNSSKATASRASTCLKTGRYWRLRSGSTRRSSRTGLQTFGVPARSFWRQHQVSIESLPAASACLQRDPCGSVNAGHSSFSVTTTATPSHPATLPTQSLPSGLRSNLLTSRRRTCDNSRVVDGLTFSSCSTGVSFLQKK